MTAAVQSYRVQRGDTLNEIAHRHGVQPEALMRANGMDPALADGHIGRKAHDPDRLQVGQRLTIPVATPGLERQHQVAPGETLASIAERWGVGLWELIKANLPFLGAQDAGPTPTATATATAATATNTAATTGRLDLQRFTDPALGSNAAAAIVIGSAEGTRRADGGFTPAYGGHADPGNAAHNRGSFSYQHTASSPADADRRQLQTLQGRLPAYEAAARQAGLDPANARLASAYLDLYNQSPSAAARLIAPSALAPIQIGGRGFCAGLSETRTWSSSKCEPFIVTSSSVHSRLIASRFSMKRGTRSFCVVPKPLNSTSR